MSHNQFKPGDIVRLKGESNDARKFRVIASPYVLLADTTLAAVIAPGESGSESYVLQFQNKDIELVDAKREQYTKVVNMFAVGSHAQCFRNGLEDAQVEPALRRQLSFYEDQRAAYDAGLKYGLFLLGKNEQEPVKDSFVKDELLHFGAEQPEPKLEPAIEKVTSKSSGMMAQFEASNKILTDQPPYKFTWK